MKHSNCLVRRSDVAALVAVLLAAQPAWAQTDPMVTIQPAGSNRVQITWPPGTNFNVLQGVPALTPTNQWLDVPDAPAILGTRYAIYRDATNAASFYRLANRGIPGQATPPDPASNAPPLVPNTFNDLGSSTAFLYTGSNAVQIGVAPGTIAPTRAAVVRGKVMRRDKSPLPGVRVVVLNHPEYGYTFTRQDGMYDLALNGGFYTVDFQAMGYCPAQRQVEAPFQDFRTVPDVALVPLDPVATPVSFSPSAPPQMAAGSPQTDDDGTRTTRVFLPAGTTASVLMPDGSARPVSSLTLRLTEYTVGTNGQAAMPAPLPPTSAYTFCAEFSADEAMNAGAKSIQFNQPVWGYVENFLDIPVGMMVPSGYYDRDQSAWVPSQNGIVLKILGVTNGLAQVDLTGSNVVADATMLAALTFSAAELQQLASTYSPGQSVWRVPLNHFTPWDWNYALGVLPPKSPNSPGDKAKKDPCPPGGGGGTVNVGQQVFQETIPLVGVPMALHYSSARVPDYRAEAKAEVAVLSVPFRSDIEGVQAQYEVAGQYTDEQVGKVESVTLSWDGYDVYGRYMGGTRQARGRIVIELGMIYGANGWGYDTRLNHPLFTSYGQTSFAAGHGGGRGIGLGASFTRMLTIPDHRTIGLGGWSLTPHHSYDPAGHFLYLGTGKVLKQDRFANGIGPVPGLNAVPNLNVPLQVAAGPDGTVYFQAYFADSSGPRFFKLGPDGGFTFLSGNSRTPGVVSVYNQGYASVDGKSALLALINVVADMTVGPDGSLYFREQAGAIGRIDPQGNLHLVLGDGPRVYPPDGTPAREAWTQATDVGRIAVARDGTVYYDDWWNTGCVGYNCGTNFIRKVAPDGRIYTVAGQAGALWGDNFFSPTNGWRGQMGRKASEALLTPIRSLATAPDGTLYVSPYALGQYGVGGIYKISPDGTLGMVMNAVPLPNVGWAAGYGAGDEGTNATSLPYHSMSVGPHSLQVTSDGSLAFYQYYGISSPSIWRIMPDGVLQRLAGRGNDTTISPPYLPSQQGANPLQVTLPAVVTTDNFAVGPDGSLTLGGNVSSRTAYRIAASASGFTGQELQIAAEDASEIYVFDAHGLHLRTLNALTGATNWSFTYDPNNLVTQLRNGHGLATTVVRNLSGQPTAIVGPYGQRTTLALDANGFLAGVTNPVGEAARFTNSTGGLLLSITGPRQATYDVVYDGDGLVAQTFYPLGGGLSVSITNRGTRILAMASTPLGSTEFHDLQLLTSGDTYRHNTYSDGTVVNETLTVDGAETVTYDQNTYLHRDYIADPRFPVQTRLLANQTWSLMEAKLNLTLQSQRSAKLSDPSNPFSVVALTNQILLNGQPHKSVYTGSNRTTVVTSPEGRQITAVINEHGRPIHQQKSGQPPVDITYDTQGRVVQMTETTSVGAQSFGFGYDLLGRLSAVSDPLGRTNTFTYDGAGRPQQGRSPDGQTVGFTVDAENHLTSVTPPGRPAHRFDYNAVGMLTNYSPPMVNGADESVRYTYDSDRNLTAVVFPDGQTLSVTRAPGGNVLRTTLGSGPTLTNHYGTYGLLNRIDSSTGDGLAFNSLGMFLVTNLQWSGTITGSLAVQINSSLLPAVQSINGSPMTFAYDRDTLLTRAGDLTLTRDPTHGGITATALGGLTDQRQFDDRGLLTNYVALSAGTPIWSVTMSYDTLARLTNKVEVLGGITNSFGYAYDLGGRLQQVWQNGALSASYTYDANGNRLTRNGETAAYDAQDRVTSYGGNSFTWSPNGTLQSRTAGGQVTTYTCDVRGALTGVLLPGGPPVAYVLDPVGHRIGKKVGGALQRGWLWSGIVPVAELGANSEVTARFVFGSRRNVPDYILKGTDRFRFFTDERGSVRLVVNVADGSVAQQLDYDEFGRVLTDTNPGFQPFGFAGGLYDPDTGLVHFGLREYSAETGQWTARDPVLFAGGQTSLYAYVSNDPINRSDPLGTGPFYLANDELAGYAGNVNDFGVGGLGMVATWAGKERLASVINAGGLVAGTVLGGIQVAYSASQTWDAFQGNDQMAQAGAFYGLLGNTFSFGTPLFLYIAQNGATSAGAFATPQMLAGTGASQLSAGQLGARLGLAGLFMTTSVNLAATSIGNAMQGKPTPIDIGADLVGQVLFGLPSQIYGRDCP